MSRRMQPARLWLRPARGKRKAVWLILDDRKQFSTGCFASDRAGAENAFEEYIGKKRVGFTLQKHSSAEDVYISDALRLYLNAKSDELTRPDALFSRVERLSEFWGTKKFSDVNAQNCKAYTRKRKSESAARRELEDLRAALNFAIAEGLCRESVKVTLPGKSKNRTRFLTRSEVAALLLLAWRARHKQGGKATKCFVTKHVAKFMLTALYTGSRSARVWQASFVKEVGRPWVDLKHGLFFREAPDEQAPDNKRAPPIRLPGRLLAHLRRWHRKGARYVCEYQGRAADPKKAFSRLVARSGLGNDVVRHTFRHTCVTWLMQSGEDKWEVAGYAGMSLETLEKTYGHHHPNHQTGIGNAFSSGRAGRIAAAVVQ